MAVQAPIIEIFSSLQGEGPRVGERHLFVRFQDCELSCKFCDTPASFVVNKFCRVESPPFSRRFRNLPNPLSVELLNEQIGEFGERVLSVTGGEPLQKAAFLREWLPTVRPRFLVLLETAGVHFSEFREIAEWVDIVAMDVKFPSVTGMHPWWREHEAFLKAALGKELYVKAVVSSETSIEDLRRAVDLVASVAPETPFVLQPASAFARFRAVPAVEQLAEWQTIAQKTLKDVRVIPQMHKQLGVL
ncbi:MAG TPA: 7-carboxy-7-deazaguanine synthase QueE [bacterium]|nr:7-carboxy-7-deazaguanine synthase QueE [bacterium]